MSAFLLGCAAVLALALALGLARLARGPDVVDRLAAAQLVGSVGVAIVLVLAEATGEGALRLVALLLAVLGSATVAAYLRVSSPVDPPLAPAPGSSGARAKGGDAP